MYYLHTPEGKNALLSNASQVGVPALAQPTTSFKTIRAPLPQIDIQEKIIMLLETIRLKIENSNKINANLGGVYFAL